MRIYRVTGVDCVPGDKLRPREFWNHFSGCKCLVHWQSPKILPFGACLAARNLFVQRSLQEHEKPPPPLHISTCKSVCLETKDCIAFVHIKKTSQCYMKSKKQCTGKALVDTPGRSTHFVPGYVVAPRLGVAKA